MQNGKSDAKLERFENVWLNVDKSGRKDMRASKVYLNALRIGYMD